MGFLIALLIQEINIDDQVLCLSSVAAKMVSVNFVAW
jgi:hypothetical protein